MKWFWRVKSSTQYVECLSNLPQWETLSGGGVGGMTVTLSNKLVLSVNKLLQSGLQVLHRWSILIRVFSLSIHHCLFSQ